eukprot:TRINITY_DN4841_c0_g1_i7.p3 TRINITY_DN4841_c0_g1~~TRINITY_DN4841_c0_g1_i7.p3  ORF type:complete len:273 (-),score=25.05 TRINITY_DN4841_c0_g1_i7:379-1197(-)
MTKQDIFFAFYPTCGPTFYLYLRIMMTKQILLVWTILSQVGALLSRRQGIPNISSATFRFPQSTRDSSSYSTTGNAVSGNEFGRGNINSLIGSNMGQFGLGIQQISENNNAVSISDAANSGNRFTSQNIQDSSAIIVQDSQSNQAETDTNSNSGNIVSTMDIGSTIIQVPQFAQENQAQSSGGDANSGNNITTGDLTESNVDFLSTALYNDATSVSGDANSGNINSVGDIVGGEQEVAQGSLGNTVYSETGDSNSGNKITFGSLLGRKLLLY